MKKMLKIKDFVVFFFCEEVFGMGVLEVILRGILLFVIKKSGIVDVFWEVEGGDVVIVENNNVKEWVVCI